ncbi:MAG TPA: MBL fold metallo-hydrolase [Nitrospira sp.]|nr:MBL fold metallo-hydrolase [Nitrospira sp.]
MADRHKRLDSNVSGNFYVDSTCIDCDACRQLAPQTFREIGDYSAVVHQPTDESQEFHAYQALLACPVGSIGTERSDKGLLQEAKASFPLQLEDGVFYCGFNSEKSFGANSFFVRHPDGNWLVDSPRYVKQLVEAFDNMGGISIIFLTHEDDIADAEKYAKRFGAKRMIHRADAHAVHDAEWIIDGTDAVRVGREFQVVPVPGHTPGSQALLYRNQFLFTGDHLWWEPEEQQFESPRQLVWNHEELVRSIGKLRDYRFTWILAGHGGRVRLSEEAARSKIRDLVESRQAELVSRGARR